MAFNPARGNRPWKYAPVPHPAKCVKHLRGRVLVSNCGYWEGIRCANCYGTALEPMPIEEIL